MTNFFSAPDEQQMQQSIQASLQDAAAQMGQPIDQAVAARLYREARELLNHIAYEPITLARVAGTLLVYQLQKSEAEEQEWFKSELSQCLDDESVEELIESMHRTDAL